jgi:hypothetical protein
MARGAERSHGPRRTTLEVCLRLCLDDEEADDMTPRGTALPRRTALTSWHVAAALYVVPG